MRRWDYVQEGVALMLPYMTGHMFLKAMLEVQHQVSVGRFLSVAGMACCRAAWGCGHGWSREKRFNCTTDGLWRTQAIAELVLPTVTRLHTGRCAGWRRPAKWHAGVAGRTP
eukprot:CAMPEP_0204169158 /NCGR_PEP_ID=MMETSP0361-20130328/41314_1 /ASSEMBLY_ACC=CAM_ASM_000343 /TAXON_ID=268821 /ORGANISM="Scrippsiella Hangoei, Strain SHTV-5" /LENGTH=111 /DNA_ID=CAMNT_0051126707 /DNA_START=9 /DNA_END=340 /DNA_ORIENTATION=+